MTRFVVNMWAKKALLHSMHQAWVYLYVSVMCVCVCVCDSSLGESGRADLSVGEM